MNSPDFILFTQHGWSDNATDIIRLAQKVANPETLVIAPSLGLLKTYWRMKPLINQLEIIAIETINQYPHIPLKIIGHSMGGLIWLELLNRHPQWWDRVDSLVLIGSPIGGSHLARMIDPLGVGIGIAKDLGTNRRAIAEKIAQKIPTLAIAGDTGTGTDGMVTVANTKFAHSKFICLQGISHPALKCHPRLVPIIREFWVNPQVSSVKSSFIQEIIRHLQTVPKMTDGHCRDFEKAQVYFTFPNQTQIRTWKNLAGVDHVFVADQTGQCLYSGYVGWLHASQLQQALRQLSTLTD